MSFVPSTTKLIMKLTENQQKKIFKLNFESYTQHYSNARSTLPLAALKRRRK